MSNKFESASMFAPHERTKSPDLGRQRLYYIEKLVKQDMEQAGQPREQDAVDIPNLAREMLLEHSTDYTISIAHASGEYKIYPDAIEQAIRTGQITPMPSKQGVPHVTNSDLTFLRIRKELIGQTRKFGKQEAKQLSKIIRDEAKKIAAERTTSSDQ